MTRLISKYVCIGLQLSTISIVISSPQGIVAQCGWPELTSCLQSSTQKWFVGLSFPAYCKWQGTWDCQRTLETPRSSDLEFARGTWKLRYAFWVNLPITFVFLLPWNSSAHRRYNSNFNFKWPMTRSKQIYDDELLTFKNFNF